MTAQLQLSLGPQFTVERELGGGGMSRVFVVRDSALERNIVVKVLPEELAHSVNLERFRREIQLAAQLQHPHIVPLLWAGVTNDLPFFAMPFVDGESVDKVMARQESLGVSDILRMLREVAAALAYAHERGVIHRDIKPANLLLSHGSVMVTDFGIAKALSDSVRTGGTLTDVGIAIGTPSYMAPEHGAADPDADHRADIYSFGILAYELLAGRPPFVGKPPQMIIAAHIVEKPEPVNRLRADAPPALSTLVMHCLEKDPAERPQHASSLLAALDSILFTGVGPGFSITPETPSIAVLPFTNMSADPENEFFSDGITEEILHALAQIPSMRTAARTSSFAFKGRNLDVSKVAAELRVKHILEGSVRRAGERVRITAQLIDAENGFHLWSETYDRELSDVFAIQEEIARTLARTLQLKLTTNQDEALRRRQTESLDAYQLYLRGRHCWNRRGQLQKAMKYFEEALRVDPEYSLAHHGVSDAYSVLGLYGFVPPQIAMPRAKAAAIRSLELTPDSPEALTSLGFIQTLSWEWDAAEKSLLRAIEINPRYAPAHTFLAWLFTTAGRSAEAMAAARDGHLLDPLSSVGLGIRALVHYHSRDYDGAIEMCKTTLELEPASFVGSLGLCLSYAGKGMFDEAVSEARRGVELSPEAFFLKGLLGAMYGMAGQRAETETVLATFDKLSGKTYVGPVFYSWIHAQLGDPDTAFDWLEKAYQERSCTLALGLRFPLYDPLRNDPRFPAFMQRLGLAADANVAGTGRSNRHAAD